jgi:excisionase family DNA binding protein
MAMPIHSPRSPVPLPSVSVGSEERLLFTLNQAAQSLAISKRTLERLIAGGTFPVPLKIGRSSRVPREDIAEYLEQLRRQRGDKMGAS